VTPATIAPMLSTYFSYGMCRQVSMPVTCALRYALPAISVAHVAGSGRTHVSWQQRLSRGLQTSQYQSFPEHHPAHASKVQRLDFTNTQTIHAHRSYLDLFRAYLVYKACSFPSLVKNADVILGTSRKLLGTSVVNSVVKNTFFKHFCAGACAVGASYDRCVHCSHCSLPPTSKPPRTAAWGPTSPRLTQCVVVGAARRRGHRHHTPHGSYPPEPRRRRHPGLRGGRRRRH
jgi:hypothetical protein